MKPAMEEVFQFTSYMEWVNKAQSWFRSIPEHRKPAACYDAKGRRCSIGGEFMRARDEGAFPVRVYVMPVQVAEVFECGSCLCVRVVPSEKALVEEGWVFPEGYPITCDGCQDSEENGAAHKCVQDEKPKPLFTRGGA